MVRIAVLCAKSPYYSEMNTEKRHGNRTRVAIACTRCRKKKVKCSGEEGDGMCERCRHAGLRCEFRPIRSSGLSVPDQDPTWLGCLEPCSGTLPPFQHGAFPPLPPPAVAQPTAPSVAASSSPPPSRDLGLYGPLEARSGLDAYIHGTVPSVGSSDDHGGRHTALDPRLFSAPGQASDTLSSTSQQCADTPPSLVPRLEIAGANGTAAKPNFNPAKGPDRKYPCPQCSKTYLQAKHLKRHQLQHTGERPYSCSLCGKTSSRSDIIKTHFQRCSIRRGNPTGATHLSNAQSHSRRRNPKKQDSASSTGSAFSIASQSGSAFYANGSSATVLAGSTSNELSFLQFAARLFPCLVGTGDGTTVAPAMGPAVLGASPYESSERSVTPRTRGAASACTPEACGEGSAVQDMRWSKNARSPGMTDMGAWVGGRASQWSAAKGHDTRDNDAGYATREPIQVGGGTGR